MGDTNLYGYTFNDPVNFIDPNGMDATTGFIGSHEVIRVTNPNSPTAVTYAAFFPNDGKGLYAVTPGKEMVSLLEVRAMREIKREE